MLSDSSMLLQMGPWSRAALLSRVLIVLAVCNALVSARGQDDGSTAPPPALAGTAWDDGSPDLRPEPNDDEGVELEVVGLHVEDAKDDNPEIQNPGEHLLLAAPLRCNADVHLLAGAVGLALRPQPSAPVLLPRVRIVYAPTLSMLATQAN